MLFLKSIDKPHFWLVATLIQVVPMLMIHGRNGEYFLLIVTLIICEIILGFLFLSGPSVCYIACDNERLVKTTEFFLITLLPFAVYPIYQLVIGVAEGGSSYLLEARVKMLEGKGTQFGYLSFFFHKLASIMTLIFVYLKKRLSLKNYLIVTTVVISFLSEGGRSFSFFLALSIFFIQMCKNGFPIKNFFIFSLISFFSFSLSMPVFRLNVPVSIESALTGALWFFGYSIGGFYSFEYIYTYDIGLSWPSIDNIESALGLIIPSERIVEPYIEIPGQMQINTFSAYGLYFSRFQNFIFIFIFAKTAIMVFFYKLRNVFPIFNLMYLLLIVSYPMIGLTDYFVENLYFGIQLIVVYIGVKFLSKTNILKSFS